MTWRKVTFKVTSKLLLGAKLIETICEHKYFKAFLLEDLRRKSLFHHLHIVARHVVDALLALLHPVEVLVEADSLVLRLRGGN